MFSNLKSYNDHHHLQVQSAKNLSDSFVPKMSFEDEDIIMDIGCGPGDITRHVYLSRIPKFKKLIAVDVHPNMIEYARAHASHEKIEYHVADLEDKSSLRAWEGKISKIFSSHCFNWLKDHKKAFQSLHGLLKPKGEAVVAFAITAPLWNICSTMKNDSKWNRYLKDVEHIVPESHNLHLGAEYYRKLLEDLGFEILLCVENDRTYIHKDDAEIKAASKFYTLLTPYIPDELLEDFVEDLLMNYLKLNGRNSEGLVVLPFTVLTAHVRKP